MPDLLVYRCNEIIDFVDFGRSPSHCVHCFVALWYREQTRTAVSTETVLCIYKTCPISYIVQMSTISTCDGDFICIKTKCFTCFASKLSYWWKENPLLNSIIRWNNSKAHQRRVRYLHSAFTHMCSLSISLHSHLLPKWMLMSKVEKFSTLNTCISQSSCGEAGSASQWNHIWPGSIAACIHLWSGLDTGIWRKR